MRENFLGAASNAVDTSVLGISKSLDRHFFAGASGIFIAGNGMDH